MFESCTVDKTIKAGKVLSKNQAIWINDQAIKIHQQYLKRTDDTDATGTDQEHLDLISFYTEGNKIIRGKKSNISITQAIAKYQQDAADHLRIINEGTASPVLGDIAWQTKWYYRWLAIADYLARI